MSEQNQTEKQPILNGSPVTQDQLREEKSDLPGSQRIVEVKPGEFRKLNRMQG